MITLEDFVEIVNLEIGLALTVDDTGREFDRLPNWDSVHLLALLTSLERRTGQPISLPDVLAAANLREIYDLAVTG